MEKAKRQEKFWLQERRRQLFQAEGEELVWEVQNVANSSHTWLENKVKEKEWKINKRGNFNLLFFSFLKGKKKLP